MTRDTLKRRLIALATEAQRMDRPAAGILLCVAAALEIGATGQLGRMVRRWAKQTDWRLRYGRPKR